MKSVRCSNCGLVNFITAVECRRCGASLAGQDTSFANSEGVKNFNQSGLSAPEDFTDQNRKFGFLALVCGSISSIAPWILTFSFGIVIGKLNALFVVFGLSFVVVGIGVVLSPPKSKLDAEENKPRNGLLILVGLILGLIEAFFFNKTLGLW
jgi:hypothetical protein